MNEQLKDFLKKASEDESIKDELKALEGLSAEENAEQAAAIAQKAGFDLSAEDFAPSSAELDEDELGAVAGGEACCCQYTGLGLVDDRGAVCECPTREREFGGIPARSARSLPSAALWGRSARHGRDCGCISLGGGS